MSTRCAECGAKLQVGPTGPVCIYCHAYQGPPQTSTPAGPPIGTHLQAQWTNSRYYGATVTAVNGTM